MIEGIESLPSNWKCLPIGEAYSITKKPRSLKYSDCLQIPFAPMDSISAGGVREIGWDMRAPGKISSGTYFERGDILLAKITPSFQNGKQGMADDLPASFGVATTEVIPIQSREKISNRYFLFYYLLHPVVRKTLAGKMEGSTGRQRVPENILLSSTMPFPVDIAEQEKIAAVLWKLQEAVEVEAGLARNARDLKKSLMRHLFTHGLRNEPQKETEIGPVPESWEVVPFLDLREFLQYGTSQKCSLEKVGAPVLRIPNVVGGRISTDELKYAALSDADKERFFLQKGDILFVRTNGQQRYIGRCAVYQDSPCDSAFASYLIRARLSQLVVPEFLQYFSETSEGRNQLVARSTGAADGKYNLNTKGIDSLLIPVPSKEDQIEVKRILQTIDEKIAVHEAKGKCYRDLFRTMLRRLMTADIRVHELDIDTSAVA